MTNFDMVQAFHRAFGENDPEHPLIPDINRQKLRINLIIEEVKELCADLGFDLKAELVLWNPNHTIDINNVAKEMADILYVVYGMAANFGIPLDKVFAEVHRSNMSKLGPDGKPIYREDGKILKGPDFSPANIEKILLPKEDKLYPTDTSTSTYVPVKST